MRPKTPKFPTTDPDIVGSWPAMLRAAKRAREIAIQTHTPLVIMRNGKVAHVDPSAKPAARRGKTRKIVKKES